MFYIELSHYYIIFILLVSFLAVTEYYPFPVWKGFTTLSFPIIFTIDLVYGLPVLIVVYALIVLVVNILHKRPLRVVCFNPAQLILSYLAAKGLMVLIFEAFPVSRSITDFAFILEIMFVVSLFYIINNLLVDIVLLIRPQPYPFALWRKKTLTELISFVFSISYVILLFFLGGQNRGIIDGFSFFFFFSPLIGLSLLGASNSRLRKEKNRLKTLFSITKQLNKQLPSKDWVSSLQHGTKELLGVEATLLWIKEDEKWELVLVEGRVSRSEDLAQQDFETINRPTVFPDHRKEFGPVNEYFEEGLKTSVYAPLYFENELVGMLVVARSRTHSFNEEDVQLVYALANQLAVVVKTRLLISEQEKRIVLEERNRIAREIHDGIAQTLAGGIMKLETVKRKWHLAPERSVDFIDDSLGKLRQSLKEVRDVIYALRPLPTEHVSLQQAIKKRITTLEDEHGLAISFHVNGEPIVLANQVEKVMFETLQESLQNVIKHADATKIEVQLNYQTEHVLLKIKDNGKGFSLMDAMIKARNDAHFGIMSMNEEAKKIEAFLQIESTPGEGTMIILKVPKP
ncbi:GAF domain-containing sensor histidine kinase [Anaerobacillus sp. CMMVII]|uniref:GAF domain-containing sensor histidine kinase n=1 Tax=Anaerobacillus sp. CMMVII TaxID=2755588 RepID=UPI0021B849CB|nr:GAF domain-containing sensor histidine kinase [Anaerobacillus sp. CMMVII]